ncbi:MAG: LysM peptidoglycan-binding domain-containing protein [Chloroflexi bacterium]|nr:LysM peptidoglycan-binding domain-containing protein [Chloroflexota bacterium]
MKSISYPIKLIILSIVATLLLAACERPTPRPEDVEVQDQAPVATVDPAPRATIAPVEPETPVEEAAAEEGGETAPEAEGTNPEEGETPAEETPAEETPADGDATAVPPNPNGPITEETTHTIAAGDSLYRLSLIYGPSIEEIAAANNISETDTLDIGQVLKIPVPGSVDVTPEDPDPPAATERIHTVQAGENLFRIGLQYGFTVTELATYNGIINPDRLEVGQQVKIPPNN